MPEKYSEEIIQSAYKLVCEGNSISCVAKKLNIDRGTIGKRLKEKYGEVVLKDGKKRINSNYFDEINTEHKAYWLGFLTADGYVSSSRNEVSLCLTEKDLEHLMKFKNDLSSEHKLIRKKTLLNNKIFYSYNLAFRDKKINSQLQLYGLNNKKTYNSYIPFESIPKPLMHHYIRGIMDGDGSVTIRKGGLTLSILVTASEQMKNDIMLCIYENLKLNIHLRQDKRNNLYEIRLFNTVEIKKIYNWMYKDATIYLERKYNKFAVLG